MWMKEPFVMASFNGSAQFRDHTYSTRRNSSSSLVIRRIGENEKGVYKCIDENKVVHRTVYFNSKFFFMLSLALKIPSFTRAQSFKFSCFIV